MSKKENFNKAVFDMFGVSTARPVVEEAPQKDVVTE